MALKKIFVFSLFTGLSIGFSYSIAGTNPEAGFGFTLLNMLSEHLESSIQVLLMLISSLLAIFFIFKLASFFRQVYEHRGEGIITAILGFSGSLLVMFGWQNNFQLIVPGLGLWAIGIFIVVLRDKKNQIKQL